MVEEYLATVLLPAFNEAETIGHTIEKIKALYPDFEVLVIDDGSSDHTMQVAINAGANVWPHPYNMGNGAAIKTGLRLAKGTWVIIMDADGQHQPEEIAKLLTYRDQFDMVVGQRLRETETHFHQDLANCFYNWFASYVTSFKVKDLTSGFRMVKTDVVRAFIYLLPNTFSASSTLTISYLRSGRSVAFVPITINKRTAKSKTKLIENGLRFFLILIKITINYSPLRIFIPISILFFCIGALHYLNTFIIYQRFTNMSALLFSISVIVFLIGLVSEQITQMRYSDTG